MLAGEYIKTWRRRCVHGLVPPWQQRTLHTASAKYNGSSQRRMYDLVLTRFKACSLLRHHAATMLVRGYVQVVCLEAGEDLLVQV